jgi:hypothetical protein
MEKRKTQNRFPTFPSRFAMTTTISSFTEEAGGPGLRPVAGTAQNPKKGASADVPTHPDFQARLALEWISRFRLISHWNQSSISGSFLDWKMLTASDSLVLAITTFDTEGAGW